MVPHVWFGMLRMQSECIARSHALIAVSNLLCTLHKKTSLALYKARKNKTLNQAAIKLHVFPFNSMYVPIYNNTIEFGMNEGTTDQQPGQARLFSRKKTYIGYPFPPTSLAGYM